MNRLYVALVFSAVSLAGFGLILYGMLTGRNRRPADGEEAVLGFSDSVREPGGVLDLDIGHEGLKHKEKEAFDPEKHKPEPI
ncbi:MAG: hypothetical protein ABSG91_02365 [Syntrophobacteraceae bacterium]|jgi:hypothetical protein